MSSEERKRWLDAHPDAGWAIETFYATGDDSTSQGWEDTAALIGLILPPECAAARCGHQPES
jgi:hypothetical protein